jgi:hypothetical protein
MHDADSEIEAVEQNVNGEHECDKAKPEGGQERLLNRIQVWAPIVVRTPELRFQRLKPFSF